jgi:hypothetical protein
MGGRHTAVDKEQGDGTLKSTPLVDIMHVQLAKPIHCDVTHEHWERIQFTLVRAPVVTLRPSTLFSQSLLSLGKEHRNVNEVECSRK